MTGAAVPLCVRSNFSFLEGASHPHELIEQAARLGLPALALTDRDGVHGVVRAHVAARRHGVQLLPGATVSVEADGRIVLLAAEAAGWANLCRLLTVGRRRSPKGSSCVSWPEVAAHAGGLIALWAPDSGGPADLLCEAFGDRLYAPVARHRCAEEVTAEARRLDAARKLRIPPVAAPEILYHAAERRPLQDVLTAIRHRTPLAAAGRLLRPNAEHALEDAAAFARRYADLPGAVERTGEIAARCRFSLAELRYRYPSERLPEGLTSIEWLRQLTLDGARGRWPDDVPARMREQIERELTLIDALDYSGYFLTMYEIVRFCRREGILAQGRGSAANSVVCYCLGVTSVDPGRIDLLFERFLSMERAEPPDIDLDIEHERREEVIQHVYGKYGREHAAMVANLIRYRPRSAVRDVGKALGLAETSLDRLSRLLPHWGALEPEAFRRAGLDPERGTVAQLIALAGEILDFPRHLSIHPGGFLLGHRPVCELVPIENATMPDRTVIQWDKEDVENLGLFKVDLLGLGALSLLHRCFDLIAAHEQPARRRALTLADIPEGDEATYDMICRAETVGVFQIESRAQMAMLPRLRPRNFYDLVIEISIIRPGPISGKMVHPYLRRRRGEEPIVYPHPSLEPVLAKTCGVPLFQEQVMRLAMVAADYTPGEADQLRRDMGAWRRNGRIFEHRGRLVSRMTAKGIAPEFAERVFEQICGFGEYGFPESHAASFALIAYATAWLKCHYPAEFLCAILNAQPLGFYTPATLIDEAKRRGVAVLPVDVTVSDWECAMEHGAVRLGLSCVKGLSRVDGERLVLARRRRPFADLADFARRVALGRDRIDTLAAAGAFESLESDRRQALWEVRKLARCRDEPLELAETEPRPALPGLDATETLIWDYETTGLSPRSHPLAAIRDRLTAAGLPTADALATLPDGTTTSYAGAVICRQRPGNAHGVVFLTLEDETGFVNVVIWQQVWKDHAWTVRTAALLGVTGRIQSADGVVHLVADRFWTPRLPRAPRTATSRDFH